MAPDSTFVMADAHVGFPLAVLAALQAYNGWAFAAMLILLRRRWPNVERPFTVPGYPWIPLTFLLASLAILAAGILRGTPEIIWALGLLTLGLPAYFIFRHVYGAVTAEEPAAPA